jgi:hypothetical protein
MRLSEMERKNIQTTAPRVGQAERLVCPRISDSSRQGSLTTRRPHEKHCEAEPKGLLMLGSISLHII